MEDPDDDVALPMERVTHNQGGGGGGGGWTAPDLPGFSFLRTEGGLASATAAPETTMWPLTGGAVIVAEPLPIGPPPPGNSGGKSAAEGGTNRQHSNK